MNISHFRFTLLNFYFFDDIVTAILLLCFSLPFTVFFNIILSNYRDTKNKLIFHIFTTKKTRRETVSKTSNCLLCRSKTSTLNFPIHSSKTQNFLIEKDAIVFPLEIIIIAV